VDLIAATTRYALLPLYVRWTGSTLLHDLRRFSRTQYLSEEQIREDQWRALQAMLQYVWAHNPFYRGRFEALGIRPGDIRSFDDYRRLPLLTKNDLRQQGDALLSEGLDANRLQHRRTGGSTGIPVRLQWDGAAERTKYALALRHDAWAGFHIARKCSRGGGFGASSAARSTLAP
jgi:phenylacetate-CoA ligase